MGDPVILESDGPAFIPTLACSHLFFAVRTLLLMLLTFGDQIQLLIQARPGRPQIGLALPSLLYSHQSRWQMIQPATILMLVAMLATGPGTGKPFNPEMLRVTQLIAVIQLLLTTEDRNGHR